MNSQIFKSKTCTVREARKFSRLSDNETELYMKQKTVKSPSFIQSWDNQRFGPLSDDYRNCEGYFLVAGFPKSGNVWLTSLIAGCLDLPVEKTPGWSYVYYIHKTLDEKLLFDQSLLRGVVLIRDLRDVIVSLFHWLQTSDYKQYHKHGPHQIFYDLETMYVEFFLRRFAHLPLRELPEKYVEHGWPVIKYERLYDHTEVEMFRLFEIWNINVKEDKIKQMVVENQIESMKQKAGKVEKGVQRDHFRKGGYGNYKDEIPPHILKDIEYRFGDYLRSWGYVTEYD